MAIRFQVTFDVADPATLAHFWAGVLDYKLEDPPEGYESWDLFLQEIGVPEEEWNAGSSIVDPEGRGPRVYFQQVPEPKTTKNRLHLDLDVSGGREVPLEQRRSEVNDAAERIESLGATRLYAAEEGDHYHVTMADPEGNEFCLR